MKENWRRNPALLFDCETIKQVEETSDKLRVVEHLQNEAAGCSFLALWLDCDREGENIAHEVRNRNGCREEEAKAGTERFNGWEECFVCD